MFNSLINGFNNYAVVGAGWDQFKNGMYSFFHDGLGGSGFQGIGWAILVIGIGGIVLSWALHHFTPQTRFPGWFGFLICAILGALLIGGLSTPVTIITNLKDWLVSLVS